MPRPIGRVHSLSAFQQHLQRLGLRRAQCRFECDARVARAELFPGADVKLFNHLFGAVTLRQLEFRLELHHQTRFGGPRVLLAGLPAAGVAIVCCHEYLLGLYD
jgi:hypothetical protein